MKTSLLFTKNNNLQLLYAFVLILFSASKAEAQQPGNCLKLDGINDYVVLPQSLSTAATLSSNNAITIEYWFKGTNLLSAVRIQNTGGYIIAGYGMQHIISTDGGTNGVAIPSSVYDGRWHHIAMTWQKGAVNGFKSYVDGTLYAQRNAANVSLPTIATGAWLGAYGSNGNYTNGSLDEVRIYNIALSESNIQADMLSPTSVASINLLAHYHFNQGAAGGTNTGLTTLHDTSGNGRHGTLTNFGLTGTTTSNWMESYAMVRPTANAASNITATGFTANWSAVGLGTVNNYQLDVSTNPDFTGHLPSSPYNLTSTTLSQQLTGLLPGTYYYRVRANKSSVDAQGCNSNVMSVTIPYVAPGNALAFDGSKDYVSLPTGIVSTLSSITIETWFMYNTNNAWQRVFDFGSGTGRYLLFTATPGGQTPGTPHFQIYNGGNPQYLQGSRPLVSGKWYHLAITINNANSTGRMYINGELIDENISMTLKPSDLGATTQNWLGRSQYPDPYFNGKIDEFRIWSVVRTQAEIQAGMKAPVSTNATGLVSYYNFDKGIDGANNAGANVITDLKDSTKTANINNHSLTGSVSNWVESYAMTIPVANAPSAVSTTGFTANWTAPTTGVVNSYLVDVSLYNDFSTVISGSPFTVTGSTSRIFTGLSSNTNYYYRVRSDKSSVTGQGAISNTIIARTSNAVSPPGNCLALDGTNDYITVPQSSGINNQFTNNHITVETWFNPKANPNPGQMVCLATEQYGDAGSTYIKFALFFHENKIKAGFHYGSWTWSTCDYNLPLNRWSHLAATYDKQQIKLYVNGVLMGTQYTTLNLPAGYGEWRIGRRWDYPEYINGSLDELRIYNEALTQSQIQADMRDTVSALPNNLITYYNFDQGTATGTNTGLTILTDRSSNANYNAYLQGFALTGTNSNYVSSYAMTVPVATAASSITASGFTANWTTHLQGTASNYFLDVSTSSDFTGPVTGSPFTVSSSTFSRAITGLLPGTYYYRVRAGKSATDTVAGAVSNMVSVLINYSPPGNALNFDGVNDFVSTMINVNETNYTVELWFKTTSINGGIFSVNAASGGHDRHIYLTNGNIRVRTWDSEIISTSDYNYADGRWHHVAHLLGAGGQKIYVDGVLKASGNKTASNFTWQDQIWIGRSLDASPDYFNGSIDEVRLWNVVRTEAQIQAGMRNAVAANSTGLLAYYNFDQGVVGSNNLSSDTLYDLTTNAKHGKLNNFLLNGTSSNWVESYAMVVPQALEATNVTSSSFTVNWTGALIGTTNNFILEVSSIEDFSGTIIGYPLTLPSSQFNYTITGLAGGTYYYRVRCAKTGLTGQGAHSNTISVIVPYTPPGNALAFDGANDRLKLVNPHLGNFGSSNFTIEFWMRTTGASGYLISKRNTCGHGSFFNLSHNNGELNIEMDQGEHAYFVPSCFCIQHDGINYKALGTSGAKVNDGRWHHVALVREGIVTKIYVDGVAKLNHSGGGVTYISNSNPIDIGVRYCHNLWYNGSMDELRIWNVARPLDSLTSWMRRPLNVKLPGLLAFYDFDLGVGGEINTKIKSMADKTGNPDNQINLIDFNLEALNTNWVESYATVVARMDSITNINPGGFTLNWTHPTQGVITDYLVDVSLSPDFTAPITGSPFNATGGANSYTVSGVSNATYYCRVRANKASSYMSNHGGPSNTKVVDLKYTPPGNALKFDGNSDYGTISKTLTAPFTIEFWMKTSMTGGSTGDGTKIMSCGNTSLSLFSNSGTNKLVFRLGTSTAAEYVSNVATGQWVHIAATKSSGTGSEIALYVNGSPAATVSNSTNPNGTSLILGGSSTTEFNGAIDELRIWNVARNQIQISTSYKDTIDRNTTGLSEYYNMDQGIGGATNTGVITLKDIAGTDNGGTLSNFSLSGINSNWINSYSQSIISPTNLSATSGNCSQIILNWQNPTYPASAYDLSFMNNSSSSGYVPYFKHYVFANDSLVAILPFTSSNCSLNVNEYALNTKLLRGISYNFSVRTAYLPGTFGYSQLSTPTNIAVGMFKPNPDVPSGFTASTGKCDGSIDLGWTWQGTNPQNGFVIVRSSDTNQTADLETFNLAGTARSYVNTNLQRGQLYYYRVYAKNDCYSSTANDTMYSGVSDTIPSVGGISPQVPTRPSNVRLFADSTTNIISIRWNDNSDNEEKFGVERAAIGGLTTVFDVNPNDTSYEDNSAAGCVAYNYTIRAYSGCAVNGMPSIGTNQTRLTPNLTNTFDDTEGNDSTIYKLKCSKGYYPDRVELTWNNRNSAQMNYIRIFRKVANTTNDSVLIASVLTGSGLYIDNTTVAGIMYNYFIVGELQCAGVTRYSNMSSDIGFRSPTGTISGNITYTGGFAANGVRVLAQNTSFNKGGAVAFDGLNDYLEIKHKASQSPLTNALTIEAWYKPQTQNSFVVASKRDSANGGYSLVYRSDLNQLMFTIANGSDSQTVAVDTPFISFASYNQITAAYGSDSIRIYINGIEKITTPTLISYLGAPSSNLYLGGSPQTGIYGNGSIDEVRLWKISKTKEQITNDYNRTIERNNGNLFLYFSFDDRFDGLTETYDQSNLNLVFNENHAKLVNGATYSDSIPTNSQLALASYTDGTGNYKIENVRYLGTGQNYTVVPTMDIHSFTPANKIIFVGDGSQTLNNIDFFDNSSFEFVGTVRYAGTTCPAVGAYVLIDGQYSTLNNQFVTVNDSGKFVTRVPIGNHIVSLSQDKHTFSQGRFPSIGFYDFRGPISANFVDSTFLTVVGRVAGGKRELNKAPGLGRGKNNIGKAQFTFNSVGQSGITGCFSRSVVTNDSTGEYTAYLLPLRYTISGLRLVNNPDPTLLTNLDFGNPNVLDLTTIPDLNRVTDTLVTPVLTRVDSIAFHKQLDFKYYSRPTIYLTDTLTPIDSLVNNFIGKRKIALNDSTELDITHNELGYPVFEQLNKYYAIIKVIEKYENIDVPLSSPNRNDNVPVNGNLRIYNNIGLSSLNFIEAPIEQGYYLYSFTAGTPNQLINSQNPQYSFTKTLQIEFVPEIGQTINFLPNQGDLVSQYYRAFVFGTIAGNSNFTSTGPQVVDLILRDPPGSASSVTWNKGVSYSTAESWNVGNSYGSSLEIRAARGVRNVVLFTLPLGGPGSEIETELENDFNFGASFSKSINSEGELVTTVTNSRTISTGGDPGSVGAGADIYFGKAQNITFGNSDQVTLVDTATCRVIESENSGMMCIGNELSGYRVAKLKGFYVMPGQITTTFAYTQDEIVNLIIPDLEKLRNQFLTRNILNNRGVKKYVPVFTDASDPDYSRKFGSNNDDPIWGGLRSTNTVFIREVQDSVGPSYVFHGNSMWEFDSIRYYNNQIRLWKNAIARNEATKYKFLNSSGTTPVAGGTNISIGKASYTEDFSTTVDETYTENIEWQMDEHIGLTFGFKFMKSGVTTALSANFSQTRGASKSRTTSTSKTFSYTLQDGDDGDLISVDVVDPKDGNGHVFKLRSGRTSCPYEGEVKAMFYDPSNDTITSTTLLEDGFEIQTATAQNDVPLISVDRNNNFNIPADQEAVFILDLGNLSEGQQDRTYSLRVNPATNPFGAILKIDGLDPNRDFDVPYGTTVQKTLTVKRGPTHYDYDNLQLILKSSCDDDIFDTVSVSAHFLPTCTSVSLKSPEDRWVLNSSYHDTLPVIIGGYNYNWGGFKHIQLQYKPGGTNTWYTERTFYKDTPDANVRIPLGEPNIYYPFNFRNLPDGNYELRAVTECIAPGYPNSRVNSDVMQGLADRLNPHPIGTPSPADGILSPSDDISIEFNEDIEQSTLSLSNFEIKGVLNQSPLKSNTSLYFDGDGDYLEVSQPLDLKRKSFTIEFWHKRGALGQQVIVSQGADTSADFELGFTSDDKFYFEVNNEIVKSNLPVGDTTAFHYYAVSYNAENQTADLFQDQLVLNIGNNRIFNPYEGSGKLYIGKAAIHTPRYAKGNIYEVRIWDVARSLTSVNQTKSILLSGTEADLLASWRIDEATGNSVKDYARFRNALIVGAQWYLIPMGKSYTFDGNGDFITVPSNHFGISSEMDFSVEFWFKGTNQFNAGLLSNGKGLAVGPNGGLNCSIETDSIGRILVKQAGKVFVASTKNYFDGNWHHFALVLRRNSSLSSYIDANLQGSVPAAAIQQWGGLKFWVGARGWNEIGNPQFDSTSNYFKGQIDDIRIWNSARLVEQLKRDMNIRLRGNELGLMVYIPFEDYQEVMGVPVLNPSNRDMTSTTRTFSSYGDAATSDESPTLKLPRAAQSINFTYGVNADRIVITPTTANQYIENVTLDITVNNIQDKHGNTMVSPKTWIAYVNKNQVKWQDHLRTFNKAPGEPLSFVATIVNTGGEIKQFTIGNLPSWCKSSILSGSINPNSTVDITFTVEANLNIGKYEEDITLLTDFGFPDKLVALVNVKAIAPNWSVNPASFSKNMSIVGQIRINNVVSANTDDMLGAFVNDECRGLGKVQYYEQLDKYLVFMDVYGNTDNEQLEFRIWNSATGKTHIEVDPALPFVSNTVTGTVAFPQIFNALDKVQQRIPLSPGWNWVSFNLLMSDSANLNQLFYKLKKSNGNLIKNNTQMAVYDSASGWSGNLAAANTGVKPEYTYLVKTNQQDTLDIRGIEANPQLRTINMASGWNYIGFVSQRNISTNEALAGWTATQNDLIKGQSNFSMYDTILGWVGSLSVMKPNTGYLYKSATSGSFTYPRSAMFGKTAVEENVLSSNYWKVDPHKFQGNMNMVAKVEACANLENSGNFLLGAFVGDELRGFGKMQQVSGKQEYFLNISGKEGEQVSFRLLDETNGKEYEMNQSLVYKTNTLAGNLSQPYVISSNDPCIPLHAAGNSLVTVYPVPFTDLLNLGFELNETQRINVRLVDISGKEAMQVCEAERFDKGKHELKLKTGELPVGVYVVEVEANGIISRHKVIKL